MAENLSAFDYRTQEEVLIIIRQVTNVLSVAGMQLLEILSPSNLMAQLTDVVVCFFFFICPTVWCLILRHVLSHRDA